MTVCSTTDAMHTAMAALSEDVLTVTFQRPVQKLPRLRLSCGLDGGVG
jgi:hypothetical protein